MDDLLTIPELATALRRSPWYVVSMRRKGFVMPGNRATVREAREWLRRNPDFRASSAWQR